MKLNIFKYIILISALSIACCAAFFSVTGISELFIGSITAVAIMASSLELGKIISVSFLYRYWKEMPKFLRFYLCIGLVFLMSITSIGIYGYLSSAYSAGAANIQIKQNELALYETQQNAIQDHIQRDIIRINDLQHIQLQQENRLDSLVQKNRGTYTQQRMVGQNNSESNSLQKELSQLYKQKDSISLLHTNVLNSINSNGKISTFYYFAKALGIPLDVIVKWFILVIVVVFDPLSISLFFAFNFLAKKDLNIPTIPPLGAAEIHLETKIEDVGIIEQPIVEPNKSSNIPYFMEPSYDWKNDSRWKDDNAAKMYLERLGINPLNS